MVLRDPVPSDIVIAQSVTPLLISQVRTPGPAPDQYAYLSTRTEFRRILYPSYFAIFIPVLKIGER